MRFGTHRHRYNAAPAINSAPVTLGLTFRKKNSVARNAVDFLQSPAAPRVPVEIEKLGLYIHIVYRRRNKDKYKQEGAWKQIPLRTRNEFREDWKYLVCSLHGNVLLQRINISFKSSIKSRNSLSSLYSFELISYRRKNSFNDLHRCSIPSGTYLIIINFNYILKITIRI